MSADTDLQDIRKEIDELDIHIQELINRRAGCAERVARIKRAQGDTDESFFRPERELVVLRRVMERNQGPLSDEEMARLFREIMSACLALELPLKIAFLGPEGTFTQAAALKHFGHSVDTASLGTIDEIFREVEAGQAHFGVVPVENSSEGVITHTLDSFQRSPLRVCGEVLLRIHHHLISAVTEPAAITRIYAHQQALAQCREWLDAHMAGVERLPVSSNAEGARRAAAEPGTAAIAGEAAAEIYGLEFLTRNIEDDPDNTTRFLVIGNQHPPSTGADRTSLLISGRNRAGVLYTLLKPFAQHGISMTRIESRPSRQVLWEYIFYIDIEGHAQDANVAAAIEEIEEQAAYVRILGSYPRAIL